MDIMTKVLVHKNFVISVVGSGAESNLQLKVLFYSHVNSSIHTYYWKNTSLILE